MFKHTTPVPWIAKNLTVWDYERNTIIASSRQPKLPTATQRANARLIAIAPQMYEIIERLSTDEAKALVRYMERDDHESN